MVARLFQTMARQERLTDAKIRDLEPRDKPYFVSIPGVPLKVRIMPGGTKAYYLRWYIKQPDGSQKQVGSVIGHPVCTQRFDAVDLETAITMARTLIASGKDGVDHRVIWQREKEAFARQIQTEQMEALGTTDPENLEFLKTAWDSYYADKDDVTPRHLAKMKGSWRHIEAFLDPSIRTRDLTADQIELVKRKLKRTTEEFNKFRMALSGVLRNEIKAGRLAQNVLFGIKPYTSKRRMVILSAAGIKQFREFYGNPANFKPIDQPHARFLLGLLFTGMRPITLRSLEKEDTGDNNFVDWKRDPNGLIIVRHDKTSKNNDEPFVPVPITEQAAEIMKKAAAATPWSPYVFGTADARKHFCNLQLSEKRTAELFRKHAKRFETEHSGRLDIYSLRHTFGSMLAESNIPIHAVKDMMLHRQITTTQKYLKTTEKTRLETVRKIEGLF